MLLFRLVRAWVRWGRGAATVKEKDGDGDVGGRRGGYGCLGMGLGGGVKRDMGGCFGGEIWGGSSCEFEEGGRLRIE